MDQKIIQLKCARLKHYLALLNVWYLHTQSLFEENYPLCYLTPGCWPPLIQHSASPQLLFLGLTHNNRGEGSRWMEGVCVYVCVCWCVYVWEGVYLLWAGLGTAQNRCPGSNPISPQPSKSSVAASGHSAVSCSERLQAAWPAALLLSLLYS